MPDKQQNKIEDKRPHAQGIGWQQQTSTVVYDNPWISVSHDEVLNPANTEGIYGVVHFKHHAIGIVAVDEAGYTWLVKQTRYVLGESTWEIPEGGCALQESRLAAAQRELKEETGLSANSWEVLLEMELSNSVTDEKATVFIAKGLTLGTSAPEPTEDIEVWHLPLKQAVAMALQGDIRDAISVAALLKVHVLYAQTQD